MRTGRGFERLITFSDAVVAIALTLLVLPLVEIPEKLGDGDAFLDILDEYQGQFLAFIISFLVIWSFWQAHHASIEYFNAYDATLVRIHLVWLFTIVVLPFVTQLLSSHVSGAVSNPVYVATLLLSSLSLLFIVLHGRRHPELLHWNTPEVQRWLAGPPSYSVSVTLLIVLMMVLVWPGLGAWPLLLLIPSGYVETAIYTLLKRPGPAAGS